MHTKDCAFVNHCIYCAHYPYFDHFNFILFFPFYSAVFVLFNSLCIILAIRTNSILVEIKRKNFTVQ